MAFLKKSDILAIIVLGETVALFSLPIVVDTGVIHSLEALLGASVFVVFPVFVPLFALLGLFISSLLSRKIGIMYQIGKFVSVGVANTIIDIGVFSLLKLLTGITIGFRIAGINMVGFAIAVIHSYLWNKFWTFGKRERTGAGSEFLQFFLISVIGIMINSGIIYVLTTLVGPQFGVTKNLWATTAKIIATPISMTWNFIGYKLIVFKR